MVRWEWNLRQFDGWWEELLARACDEMAPPAKLRGRHVERERRLEEGYSLGDRQVECRGSWLRIEERLLLGSEGSSHWE